jgi:hypothetical protein
MARKPTKVGEPNLRELLSADVIAAFQADFKQHGAATVERMREKHPERYLDIAAKLIVAAEQPKDPKDFSDTESLRDIGIKLLEQIGLHEPTEDQIAAAVEENNIFVARLEAIRDGAMQ